MEITNKGLPTYYDAELGQFYDELEDCALFGVLIESCGGRVDYGDSD